MSWRYLTPAAKRAVLREWAATIRALPPDPSEGDRGLPDPDMISWCAEINPLPGLCTLQSCAGHKGRYRTSGHLWVWMDEERTRRFRERAPDLAVSPCIERVATLYQSDKSEIAAITFAGNDRDLLGESMNVVLAFFRSLAVGDAIDD